MRHRINRALCALALLLSLSASALAVDVQIGASVFEGYQYSGATATLRVYASQTFTASDGSMVGGGSVPGSTTGFYKSVTCTVASRVLSCPSITLKSTTDALTGSDTEYSVVLFDAAGTRRDFFPLSSFWLSHTNGSSTTWAVIAQYNSAGTRPPTPGSYTTQQTDSIIAALATAPPSASYITQTPDATLTGEQALSTLSTGVVTVTTTTGVLSSVPYGSNGQVLTISGGAPTWATPSLLTSTGAINIEADTDSSGTDGITLRTRATTRLSFSNDGTLSASVPYGTFASTGPGFDLTQVDQASGLTVAHKAPFYFTATDVGSGAGQSVIFTRLYCPSRIGGWCVGGLFESRTIDANVSGGVNSTHEVIGVNGVADCTQTHVGPCRGIESNVNIGANPRAAANPSATTEFATHLEYGGAAYVGSGTTSHKFSALFFAASGGVSAPDAGLYIAGASALTANSAPVRGLVIPYTGNVKGYQKRAIETGLGVSGALNGHVAVSVPDGHNAIIGQRTTEVSPAGTFLALYSSGGSPTEVFYVDMLGAVVSKYAIYTLGAANGMQVLNSVGTSGAAFGLNVPGASLGTRDIVLSSQNAGSWAEKARWTATTDLWNFSAGIAPASKAFASLGTPADGVILYCSDCTPASSPATGGGSGAVVVRQGGAWKAL